MPGEEQVGRTLDRLRHLKLKLAVGPRPGRKSVDYLRDQKFSHVCTLLGPDERPSDIERLANQLGCKWIWLPITGGRLEVLGQLNVPQLVCRLLDNMDPNSGNHVYIHCSAGIHRTGFVTYTILRLLGLTQIQALSELEKMRKVTAAQLGAERVTLAETMVKAMIEDDQASVPPT